MSSLSSNYTTTGLLVTTWLVTGLATVALCTRLYARYWRFSKFLWDDFFVVLAWMFSVPVAAQVTLASKHNTTIHIGYQNAFLTRPISQFFFYNGIWAIKISFLVFFRGIGVVALPRVRRYWITVFTLTIAAYVGVWMLNPYACWAKKGIQICDVDPGVGKFMPYALSLATSFDIVTDCLIIAIPFAILSHLQLSWRKKLILYSIFSVEVVTMLVAIVRLVIAVHGIENDRSFQIIFLIFLGHVEINTAIIVACAGTLRSLFTQKDERSATPVPWDRRPPNNSIVRAQRAQTAFAAKPDTPSAKKVPDEELALTSSHANHTRESSRPFETDMSIDLGDLLKKHEE